LSRPRLSRRTLLRGVGAAAIGLPWLEAMRPRPLAAAPVPKQRFLVMFTPNGTLPEYFVPTASEGELVLSPILSPLQAQRERLLVVSGLRQMGAGGDGHQSAMGGMLTGTALNPGPFGGDGARPAGWASGPSIDQRAASVLGSTTRLASLELGVQVGIADSNGRMCYRASDQPLPPLDDPRAVYDSVFSDLHTEPSVLEQLRRRRESILDSVAWQYQTLAAQVGAEDRVRLEQHLAAVRELELSVAGTPITSSTTCADPELVELGADENDNYPALGRLQIDLLTMALSCDITRVGSLQWSRAASPTRFTWLGIKQGHHDLSHSNQADPAVLNALLAINQWYMGELAYWLEALQAVPEADGSLLDHCLVLSCNELFRGDTHSREGACYLLAGNTGGGLTLGRHLHVSEPRPHNEFLLAVLHALGLEDTNFGNPEWCEAPLAGLV